MVENNLKPLATQILVDYHQCSTAIINDITRVREKLTEMFSTAYEYIVEDIFHQYHSYGMSGTIVTPTSRVSIHVWLDQRVVGIDFLFLNPDHDYRNQVRELKKFFQASNYIIMEFKRGLIPESLKR